VKLSHLVIEKVLLVFERLAAANVLDEEMGECRSEQIPILARQFDFRLRAIVDYENCAVAAATAAAAVVVIVIVV
jgi:hypothetical protein